MTIDMLSGKSSSLFFATFFKNQLKYEEKSCKNPPHWSRFPAEVREWLSERTGKTSVPQIFFNAKYIGGNEQLQSLVADEDKWAQEVR